MHRLALPIGALVLLAAAPAYAQGIFGPVPTLSEYLPDADDLRGSPSGGGGAGEGIFGPTFSTTEPGIFGPTPRISDYMPSARRGDTLLGGGGGPFGSAPNPAESGFGPTFSTTEPGIFGPTPQLSEYWPRASRSR